MAISRFRRLCHVVVLVVGCGACTSGTIEEPVITEFGNGGSGTSTDTPGIPGSPGVNGNGEPGSPAAGGCKGAPCERESAVASSAFPRLSHRQWAASVRDLLALDPLPVIASFTNDAPTGTSFDNNGGALVVSAGLATDYETAAEKQAADLVANPTRLAKVVPANLPSDLDGYAQGFVSGFGERVFRRPLTAAERTSFVTLFKRGGELIAGVDPKLAGVQLTVQALLQSPAFLYRIELGRGKLTGGAIDLTDYEIATRLSYMLWDSTPDASLLAAAKTGELHDAAKLATQARRLLDDSRAAAKIEEFHRQLLELDRYDSVRPAGQPEGIGVAMRQETERFVHDVLIENEGSFSDLMTANHSFVNRDLAAVYGLSGTFSATFQRVDLNPAERAGLLTRAGFLAYRAGDTAPILRGVFVNEKILCAELPPPPVFEPPKLSGTTRRERVNSITGEGTCGTTCHARLINPAGYPLEYFDDAGKYRREDSGKPVDGTAAYTFRDGEKRYDGPIEWSEVVSNSAEAHECYVRHWLEFGYGRPERQGDEPLVARVAEASREEGISVKDILVQLVQSTNFRTRLPEKP